MRQKLCCLLLSLSLLSWAQTESIVSQSRFFQIENPSYFGFNSNKKVGVLYSNTKISETSQVNLQYIFGALSFLGQPFSLGIDMSNYIVQNSTYKVTVPRFSFVYQLQIDSRTYLLPSITFGYWNKTFNGEGLIFEDQINSQTGYVSPETDDPAGTQLGTSNYIDFGASFLLHSESFYVGLSLAQINQPDISISGETPLKANLKLSLQGGAEWDINPHQRNGLPERSYLFIFNNIRYIDKIYSLNLSQEFQFNEFSLGVSQKASMADKFALNGMELGVGLTLESFDIGMQYYFPLNKSPTNFTSNVFELYLIFEFTPFRRNRRGSFKRLQINNY